jgi:hypothetical protein
MVKTIDDIEREKRYIRNQKLAAEINRTMANLIRRRKFSIWDFLFKLFTILTLGMLLINILLGNIWLLRFFIKKLLGL